MQDSKEKLWERNPLRGGKAEALGMTVPPERLQGILAGIKDEPVRTSVLSAKAGRTNSLPPGPAK